LLASVVVSVLTCAPSEEAEDFGFCACAAAAPWAECDGAGDAEGIAGVREVSKILTSFCLLCFAFGEKRF